jgi:hypothetical protein
MQAGSVTERAKADLTLKLVAVPKTEITAEQKKHKQLKVRNAK